MAKRWLLASAHVRANTVCAWSAASVKTHRFRGARPPRGSARSAPVQRGSSCHRHQAEDETVLDTHHPANAGHRAHQSAGTLPEEGHPPAAPTPGGSTPSASSPTAAPPIPREPQRCWRPTSHSTGGRQGHPPDGPPAHGRAFGGLKTGVGAGNLTSQGLRWVRHRTPPHLCSVGRPTAFTGITDLQWLTCTDEIQRRRLRT